MSSPVNLGGYQYTKLQATSICSARGQKLCKKKELMKSDFCSCGWADDVATPGYPMANGDKTGKGWCGGDNGGEVWRDCGGTDWLNSDGTISNTNGQLPDGKRHASAFCCDSQGNNISNILDNIQSLQASEQDIINQLDAYVSATGYVTGDPKVKEFVKSINSIADSRVAMFETIYENANILQTGVSQSRIDLVNQMTLLQVVEDQLNQAKAKIDQLQSTNDTKMRMVQINTYYGQRYEAQGGLMKRIILICIPILVVFILKKKEIIPDMISKYIIGIIIGIGAFIIVYTLWDIYTRNNMDFTQYDWKYISPEASTPTVWQYNKEHFKIENLFKGLLGALGICVSETCCATGMEFDADNNQCVMPKKKTKYRQGFTTNAGSTTQSFTTGSSGLKGTVVASYFNDDKNNYKGIAPFSHDSAYAAI